MNFSSVISKIKDLFKKRFFNPKWRCLNCGKEIFDERAFCEKCYEKLPFNDKIICEHCGRQVLAPEKTEGAVLVWKSSDPTVVAVSNGKVVAVGAGTATVTVSIKDTDIKDSVEVTELKDKLQKLADKMVTLGKKGDLAAIRQAAKMIRFEKDEENTYAIQKLFKEIAPKYKDRNGGYTRVLKTMPRRGDNAPMAIISFVE